MVGPAKPIDTSKYFVVCVNSLGSCFGSTGPASVNPVTSDLYRLDFPVLTVEDIARAGQEVVHSLGIRQLYSVVGASMGGMQAIEWAVTYPDRLRSLVFIASTAAASAQQIAWSRTGRQAIVDDSGFGGGDYYDRDPGQGPHRGLIQARMIAMIHYRSDLEFNKRFSRNSNEPLEPFRLDQSFDVESYMHYQGVKLVERFDANTYVLLNKMMDLHDIGRGRGGVAAALGRVKVPTQVMSVTSDFLYPRYQQIEVVEALTGRVEVEHHDIESDDGHDGFLTESGQVAPPFAKFLNRCYKDDSVSS